MIHFIGRRVLWMVLTLSLTSFVIFASLYAAPGDPATFLLQGRSATPEALAAVRDQYHLGEPMLTQFGLWFEGVLSGDFGRSIQFRQDVGGLILSRLPTTLLLVLLASVLMLVLGLLLGTMSALRPGAVDRAVLVGSTFAVATPTFIAAVVLIGVFGVQLGWFPTFGNGTGLWDRLYHLALPALALSAPLIGLVSRVTRASMLQQLGREHVDVARARGIPDRLVVWRHALKGALPPILTLTGTIVAGLFVGSVVIETAFGISGIGLLLVQSISTKDFPVVQAICLLLTVAFVVTNLVVDLLLPLIDPRVVLGEAPA
ncbi:ABC transporter permease [Nocardioides sp. LHG3406-4]|uniref:ABC transporter permease n=1 Tax=Nocardioides sp. LHG3406-4 TaxID=2804575 RepID=UPI003CE7158F